ncbi:MAG: N-Acetylneuraminate cytidylyltransferase [Candidatus Ozemobacter sibiricus]|jgi:N-acylneuraminate cytidylyltransferase|uniref:N-Acetylneuraminate cytidylyltransferase n=1 Tax=Candidatus Ozemobacter sibiricus TaxID=2268124 RepID=A0A367ZP22_9BACT|nr:MAG: N-Acetylneuraminate cytidylyltransferase [Candidatus Ozemobacter sibiricus]
MIEGQRVLAVIPARGGSKGIPRKNLRVIAGRSLLEWTWRAAQGSAFLDRTILSSEDPEIIAAMRALGGDVPFVRPAELAADTTPGIDPLLHALDAVPERYDLVVLLQPTSPLRTAADIDGAIRLCVERGAPACVSVGPVGKSPHWTYRLHEDARLSPILPPIEGAARRQDLPAYVTLNGAVYVARTDWIKQTRRFVAPETVAFLMSRESSVDVDDEIDLLVCQELLRRRLAT